MSEQHVDTPATAAVEQPAIAPAVATPEPVAAPTPEPGVAPAPVVETPIEPVPTPEAVTEAPKLHTDEAGLLSAAEPAKPEDKPAEPAKPAEAEPAPVEEIKYEFKVPDGFELPPEPLEKFTTLARELKITPEHAQSLMDLHTGAMQALADHTLAQQHAAFGEMRREWRNQIMADPEIGGAGFQTNKAAAIRMMQLFVAPERRPAFDKALLDTGMTDHPEMMRFLVNVARKFDEPAPPPPNAGGPPVGASGRAPNRGRALSYTHPRGGRNGSGPG